MEPEELQNLIIANYEIVVIHVAELKKRREPGKKKKPLAVVRRFLSIKNESSRKLK